MSIIENLKNKFNEKILTASYNFENIHISIKKEDLLEITKYLKEDLKFDFLMDLTCVDYLNFVDKTEFRFEMIYNFYSFEKKERIILKTFIDEKNPTIESLTSFYSSSDWYEREVYDMFGIHFKNHPNLKRILMYDSFIGHPLRKDYPLKKRQPRI